MYTTSLSSTQGAIAPRDEADLEFTAESMLSMGQQVVARAVEHIATIAQSPSCGNVDAAELCRSLREPAPESGSAPRGAARSPLRPTHPALLHHSGTGLSRVYPRGRRLSGGAGRLHRQHHQPLHGCLDGRSRPRAARSQCARMAARVDALPRGHGRTVHTGRLDGNV